MSLIKQKRHVSPKLRASAKGQDCLIRSPVCNGDSSTTVLCHLGGGGMGTKKSDLHAAFGCSSCHSFVDGDYRDYSPHFVKQIHYDAVERTQQWWLDHGYLLLP